MRMTFRKSWINQSHRDRALFVAPIVIALVLLFLFAQNKAVFASAWRSPLAALSDRSPGTRDPGVLYSIKPERFKPVMAVPQERVLGITRERLPPLLADVVPAEIPPMNLLMDEEPIIEGPMLLELDIPPVAAPPPPSLQSGPPPACCGTNTTLAPVPEPTTWMINILGLFLIGGAMRYRNRKLPARENSTFTPGAALPLQG